MSSVYVPGVFIGFVALLIIIRAVGAVARRAGRYSGGGKGSVPPPYQQDGFPFGRSDLTAHTDGHRHGGHDAGGFGGADHHSGGFGGGHDAGGGHHG